MDRRWALGGLAVSCAVVVGIACGGSSDSELGEDAGTTPTSTSTSTSTTTVPTATTTTPPSDGSAPTDGSASTDASTDAVVRDGAAMDAGATMSFFVTSTGSGNMGGNLGGLTGADAKCQALATAAGVGGKTWHAYLSAQGTNARDRIGAGPWYNQKGKMVAANVAGLHTTNIPAADVIDEKGAAIPNAAGGNQHDLLTGTNADGTASNDTCMNWTSNGANRQAIVGHTDSSTTADVNDRWNFAHVTTNCVSFTAQGGAGRFACFATN